MTAGEILRQMAESFAAKGCPGAPFAVTFEIDSGAETWQLSAAPTDATVESGAHPEPDFTVVTSTDVLRQLQAGEISPLTAAGRESLQQKTPLDFRLPEGASFTMDLYHRIVRFVQRFMNPAPGERIRMAETHSRVVHGGNVVGLFADTGFRSGWYKLKPGERLNEPGDTNPFPQAFVILSGSGKAQIGDETIELRPNTAYHIPPETEHVVQPSPEEPITLLWLAWGDGA